MVKKLKSGFLNHYQKRLFGKDWRSVFCILYDDSTFSWFKDQSKPVAEGQVILKDAPHLLAVGQHTGMVPTRPKPPPSTSINHMMAMGTRRKSDIYWFLFADDNDLNSWMSTIVSTLPPPPQANQETINANPDKQPIPPPIGAINPTIAVTQGSQSMPPYAAPPPYQQNYNPYPQQHQGYGAPVYAAPAYGTQPYGAQPTHTTVVVNESNRGNDAGNFATGMLMGGAMGMALGSTTHWGWGGGGGWGCGGGWGGGYGYGGHDDIHVDNSVNIYNDYNYVDSTTVTNDFTSNNFDSDFGGGDFGGGDFGGFDF